MSAKYYTEEEAADILKISVRQLAEERRCDRILHYRIIGNRIRYTDELLDQYVKNHPLNDKKVLTTEM